MSDIRFNISCADGRVKTELIPIPCHEADVSLYRVQVTCAEKLAPPPVRIAWEEPMVGFVSVWMPLSRFDRAIEREANFSRFHYGAPVLAAIGEGDRNRATISLADAGTPMEIGFGLKDLARSDTVEYTVTLFAQITPAIRSYETLLRIDRRPLPFYETVRSVYECLWKPAGYVIPQPPAAAEEPLYSTWYDFWQNPRTDRLLPDLKIAAELGMRTVILDDGWQFDGETGDYYSLCGEWQPSREKFPDFDAFVRGVHELGMKLLVWFSVPFIGKNTSLFETFRGKYLEIDDFMKVGVLDIRRPELRAFLIGHYRRFLENYDIDGFKFDFIGSFGDTPDSVPYNPAAMDCETVPEAVLKLLREIDETLGAVKTGLLYEYRQGYIGPAINVFGNMLRVGDCPYDPVRNRVGITDLRLLGYPAAVHSDMLIWRPEESPLLCARQLLNILFGVPQLSIRLARAPEAHRALIAAFLSYWTRNRDVLLHGSFRPQDPASNYPVIRAVGPEKEIVVLHGTRSVDLGERPCDLFLDSDRDGLLVENPTDHVRRAELFRCFDTDPCGAAEIPPHAVVRLDLPRMGMARVR